MFKAALGSANSNEGTRYRVIMPSASSANCQPERTSPGPHGRVFIADVNRNPDALRDALVDCLSEGIEKSESLHESPAVQPRDKVRHPQINHIPLELRDRDQWVDSKSDARGGKPTKVPYQARRPRSKAKSDDPSTWASFTDAWAIYQRGGFDGIGYEFAADDPYVGVDVDNCLRDGKLLDWAIPIVERLLPTYGEISPSGNGIKFFMRGKLPGGGKKRTGMGPDKCGAVEIYDQGRYFTITGNRWGESQEIVDLQDVVSVLYELACEREKDKANANGETESSPLLQYATDHESLSGEKRAILYLAKVDAAIDGAGGSDVTFRAAIIGHEFGVDKERWLQILLTDYNPRCVGPWTEEELRHKVVDAYERADKAFGWRLKDPGFEDEATSGSSAPSEQSVTAPPSLPP